MKLRVHARRRDLAIVHTSGARGDWASAGRRIFRRPVGDTTRDTSGSECGGTPHSSPWIEYGSFARSYADAVGFARLPRRLFRLDKCNLWPTRAGRLLGIRGGQAWDLGSHDAMDARPLFRIRGDCVMNRAFGEDSDGNVYFGEYFMNPERIPVRIWRVDPQLEHARVVYEFDAPRVRHVHAVHADPFQRDRLWITSGDFAGECYLGWTDDHFRSVQFIGDGTQLWRAVGLIFKEASVHWLTDTHIEENHVVSMDRASQTPRIHGRRDASSWYAAETIDGLYLATTTVEPGPGIRTNCVRLLASEDAVEWHEVIRFEKDRLPMRGFGFGSLSLPAGDLRRTGFWLSGEGLIGLDGESLWCSIEDGE